MNIKHIIFTFLALLLVDQTVLAATTRNECLNKLKELVVPSLKNNPFVQKGYGPKIQVDIDDYSGGVYTLRLTLPKQPTSDNPDESGIVGWVTLDTNQMKAFDISNDEGSPVPLNVDPDLYKSFVQKCTK